MKVKTRIFKCTGLMPSDLGNPYIHSATALCDKIFFKNVEKYRGGSAINHRNQKWGWQCAGKTCYMKTIQETSPPHPLYHDIILQAML